MFYVIPVLLKDFYKVGHKFQYPKGTSLVYSNLTARGTRRVNPTGDPTFDPHGIVFFGLQYFVQEFLMNQFEENFFSLDRETVMKAYQRRIDTSLGPGTNIDHIGALHDLGYLPLLIKAVPEGTLVPYRVPCLTIRNTKDEFFWLTNMLETIMSSVLWRPITSATTAFHYRRVFEWFAQRTGAPKDFVKWQGHDFSFRGMDPDAAIASGAAHLLSFTGSDTIPAIDFLEAFYGADAEKELVAGSVPATEHSVMCMGLEAGEKETFRRLISEIYPKGIVSIVSDTWDLWTVLTSYLPDLREVVTGRDGKVVIRPDSGDPVKILCGDRRGKTMPERKGVIRLLYEVFGGTRNAKGYIELDPHVGAIYGDSITPERQYEILSRLEAMGFASSNIVMGIGSFTYQYVTRDTDGLAMKATYGAINGVGRDIFKDPKTDSGIKKSAKGLLKVTESEMEFIYRGENKWPAKRLICTEGVDWAGEGEGLLETVFEDGELKRFQTLSDIRAKIDAWTE